MDFMHTEEKKISRDHQCLFGTSELGKLFRHKAMFFYLTVFDKICKNIVLLISRDKPCRGNIRVVSMIHQHSR